MAGGRVGVEVGGWAVEADEGVEVDHAAPLVLGDFGELHPHQLPGRGFGEAEVSGQLPAQGDGEPPPQFRRPPLPHQMAGVVVAVRRTGAARSLGRRGRGWSCTTAAGRAGRACRRSPVRGVQRRLPGRPGFFAVWTGPNEGAVRVANTIGCAATVVGHVFHAAGGAGHQHMPDVALVLMGAGRADRRPPVPASHVGHAVRIGGGVVGG